MKDENKRLLLRMARSYQEHKEKFNELFEKYIDALDNDKESRYELEKMKDQEELMVDVSARALAAFVLELEEDLQC